MNSLEVSRRRMLGLVGASIVAVPGIASAAPNMHQPEGDVPVLAVELIAPLGAGSTLGQWTVRGVSPVRHGAMTVALADGADMFYLDVCARDDGAGAYEAPARSDRYDVFLSNHGTGAMPTVERQGLAAMALAEILRSNEHRVVMGGFMTLRERLARHSNEVVCGL